MASTIVVSFSELDTARQCLYKHELAYKQRWQRPAKEGGALARGTLWHKVMETHYRTLQAIDRSNRPIEKRNDTELVEVKKRLFYAALNHLNQGVDMTDDQALVYWMYVGYVLRWGLDPEWKILAVEQHMQFWLPTPKGGRSRFQVKMKLDLVIQDPMNRIWIVDHKSGRNLPDQKMLEFNDQFGLYIWGLRNVGKTVHGAIHSAARTQRNKDDSLEAQPLDTRFSRTLLFKDEVELDEIAHEAYATARIAYGLKVGEAPRSPDDDRCGWRCDFGGQTGGPCLAGRKGGDTIAMLKADGFDQNFERH